jgi:hypothetical protein
MTAALGLGAAEPKVSNPNFSSDLDWRIVLPTYQTGVLGWEPAIQVTTETVVSTAHQLGTTPNCVHV